MKYIASYSDKVLMEKSMIPAPQEKDYFRIDGAGVKYPDRYRYDVAVLEYSRHKLSLKEYHAPWLTP